MFPFRVYPSVTFNLTRTLVVGASVCVSVVLILVYLYSHNHYQREHLPLSYRLLPNGTKIVVVVEPATNSPVDRWHEKIRAALQTSANFGFIHAFVASISVIVVSELGDKTFFIAAIMAMRHSRLVIYAGAMAALAAMTVLSALLGNIVTNFIPRSYTYYISSVLFAGFGVKMLRDGYLMPPEEGTDEYEEAQHEVDKAENNDDLEAGATRATPKQRTCVTLRRYVSPIFLQALVMTFLAEWGDRSQITTIVLAASENLFGVIVGGTIGHGFCTGLAVIGGRFVAQRISPKTVTLVGGIVFLCFAISAFFIRPDH